MNRLQENEFQIMKYVIEICDKLELRYFLVCGSALGAVKYQGFIPWDDDIDIGMFRDDYEKFCVYAPKMLPEYYFLQNYKSDKYFPALYSKVRDSRTTYIESSVSNLDINHGIYIDIFPLDGYPKNRCVIQKFELKKMFFRYSLFCSFNRNFQISSKAKILHAVGKWLRFDKKTNKILERFSQLISNYPVEDSILICNHGNWQGQLEYAPKEQYGNGIMLKFEGLDVRVPEHYDEYLTQKYGEWKKELPLDKQVSHHRCEVCDLDKAYIEYIKEHRYK